MAGAGGLRPAKHTRVLATAKTLAGSPAARARLSPAARAHLSPAARARLSPAARARSLARCAGSEVRGPPVGRSHGPLRFRLII